MVDHVILGESNRQAKAKCSIIPHISIDLNGRIYFRLRYLVTLNLVGKHVLPKMVTLLSTAERDTLLLSLPLPCSQAYLNVMKKCVHLH